MRGKEVAKANSMSNGNTIILRNILPYSRNMPTKGSHRSRSSDDDLISPTNRGHWVIASLKPTYEPTGSLDRIHRVVESQT